MTLLAVTGPHGAAAWWGWAFGIAGPAVSVFVAGVALYLSRADKRREAASERRQELVKARSVFGVLEATTSAPGIIHAGQLLGTVRFFNDSSEPVADALCMPVIRKDFRQAEGVTWNRESLGDLERPHLSAHSSFDVGFSIAFVDRHGDGYDFAYFGHAAVFNSSSRSVRDFAAWIEWRSMTGYHWRRFSTLEPICLFPVRERRWWAPWTFRLTQADYDLAGDPAVWDIGQPDTNVPGPSRRQRRALARDRQAGPEWYYHRRYLVWRWRQARKQRLEGVRRWWQFWQRRSGGGG